ncbi:Zn-ribbon domain-containing OB-fold protein [Pigmentiphaga litoralis]|uniref:DNA-binding protein n=1 Tax=Pigmentiphaga litoralis TaxID=516702 RepID=A0A7Y9LL08_9BURK|nr:OB-fold domain-containing protein [Pigmentiphaga litoralis]NYE22911.1 hypothetical protein [Pigmentiphaga litoralis]NYE83474.1 hypothetical protein [Pigmentiphaga litoralis]
MAPPLPDESGTPSADAVGADLHYRRALDQGQFLIQRCGACDRSVFYPRMVCPHCGSDRLDWFAPSGAATVYSTTVVRGRPQDGGDRNVALLDLAEGVRMMSRVDGIAPADVKIGMAVQARVLMAEDGGKVVFVPADVAQAIPSGDGVAA